MYGCYNCGAGHSTIDSVFCGDNCESEYNDYIEKDYLESQAGNQSDNAAAAQALSQTIQAPQDRGSDPSRVTGGTPECDGCGDTKGVFPLNDEANICHSCAGDMADSQAESRTYGD